MLIAGSTMPLQDHLIAGAGSSYDMLGVYAVHYAQILQAIESRLTTVHEGRDAAGTRAKKR